MLQMIAGKRPEFGTQGGRTARRELLGVDANPEPQLPCAREQSPRVIQIESDRFDECVHAIGELLLAHSRQQLIDHKIDIFTRIRIGRHGVCRQEGRHQPHARLSRQLTDDPQHLDLVLDVEAIAALDLERGHSFRGQGGESRARSLCQLTFTRGAHCPHRGDDASARACDFRVGEAGELHAMFTRPIPRIDRMRMTVNETRKHDRTSCVIRISRRTRGVEGDDAAIADGERSCDTRLGRAVHRIQSRVIDS